MAILDLSQCTWNLEGWRQHMWRLGRSLEAGVGMSPDIGPIPARVPGSVQQNLHEAGILPDWNVGLNSLACEWVEHRHWLFETRLAEGTLPDGERVCLDAEGLDYSGWILVDGKEVAAFSGTLIPKRIDLTAHLADGKAHRLAVVFDTPPEEQGQIGYTVRTRFFKPRFAFSWDWTPRMVPIGFLGHVRLVTGSDLDFSITRVVSTLSDDNRTGAVTIEVDAQAPVVDTILRAALYDGDREVATAEVPVDKGDNRLVLDGLAIEPWWPNGAGNQTLYRLDIRAVKDSRVLWQEDRSIGFKRVEWRANEGAPEGAEPWICVVNGTPIFLQGANWVPTRTSYLDSSREDYEALLGLYRDMGANVLRVWGGALLESPTFYELCDRLGILVWQEFPLSSSGVDNTPPYDQEAIDTLRDITLSCIRRRSHHVSLLLWCGGNELTVAKGDGGEIVPAGYDHPCIAAMKEIVEREDPVHRFIATSPTGPTFFAQAQNYGKGIHHDVHGPWGLANLGIKDTNLDPWREYWAADDSLFRSEVGMPGAATPEQFERYLGDEKPWPPTGPVWLHTSSWWIQYSIYHEQLEGLPDQEALQEYIRRTQAVQAEAYAIAAAASKGRFPRCGGFIIWMGHDCFPCAVNNSVIDFLRKPKPAYYALQRVFKG